jgi:hypothetical protein
LAVFVGSSVLFDQRIELSTCVGESTQDSSCRREIFATDDQTEEDSASLTSHVQRPFCPLISLDTTENYTPDEISFNFVEPGTMQCSNYVLHMQD